MIAINTSRGPWIRTYSGLKFHPLDPRPEDICILDIATALSRLCRFAGHPKFFWSVGQHSIACSMMVGNDHAPGALLHDATEAYLVDLPKPVKVLCEQYQSLESSLAAVISDKFQVCTDHPVIHSVDVLALASDQSVLLPDHPEDMPVEPNPYYCSMVKAEPMDEVKHKFINLFRCYNLL
jgi:hypothetical protein